MAKRIADKELTDRNWDQEDEGEEAGTFSIASEDVMKNRPIKKAKRRNAGAECESSGPFKGFKGFSLTQSAAGGGTTPAFSGFGSSAGLKNLAGLTNGNGPSPHFGGFTSPAATSTSAATPGLMFNGPASTKPTADITVKQTNGSTLSPTQSSSSCSSISSSSNKEYSRQLTALNCSVRDWITKHVNDNPLCDLNPIFRDYERHLASIERKYGAGAAPLADGGSGAKQRGILPTVSAPPSSSSSSTAAGPPPASALFSFGKEKDDSARDKSSSAPLPAGVTFNFGQKVDSSVLGSVGSVAAAPSLSSSDASSSQASLFGAAGSAAPGTNTEATQPTEENEEEEPNEVREIKEKDAFYSKKCKLFYMKETQFVEKGVGTLHLKLTSEGKTQMIVRADTNLGNILLNIIVQASMPCSRRGKNNVVVVCVPNPPVYGTNSSIPVPLLIRVKTAEDADELHKILEEKKA